MVCLMSWLSGPRVAPNSDRVAFIEHPFRHGESGRVMMFEPGKGVRVLSEGWASAVGLAWYPGGNEALPLVRIGRGLCGR